MARPLVIVSALLLAICGGNPAASQPTPATAIAAAPSPFTYADIADLATISPLVVDARIRKATPLPPERATGIAAGQVRIYVEADVVALIRSASPLAPRIAWLVDLPLDARGKPPKLAKQRVLAFGRAVSTGQIALATPDGQLPWDPATEGLTRRILTEIVRPGAPGRVTGVARGFHQAGALPGEGESQFFVETESGDPLTLTVLRSPQSAPRWAAAFGEIVDGAASVPARDTLGWYRLACGLPRDLPAARIAADDDEGRTTALADYRFVIGQLGNCRRTRNAPPR